MDARLEFCLTQLPTVPRLTIEARKYDGSLHRAWSCSLIRESAAAWMLYGVFETVVRHPLLGNLQSGTHSVEYYWKNQWYNVFCFYEPGGDFRSYYCNVNLPPVLESRTLSYTDLDLDVLVQPDLSYRILDDEEFRHNSVVYQYPTDVIERSRNGLRQIVELIETRQFPFGSAQLLP